MICTGPTTQEMLIEQQLPFINSIILLIEFTIFTPPGALFGHLTLCVQTPSGVHFCPAVSLTA